MKKILVVVATLILVMTCAMMVACGGVEGTYKFSSMTYGETTVKAGEEFQGQKLDADSFTYTLEKDGVLKVTEGEESMEGTWKASEEEGKYELTIASETVTVEISGGKLVYSANGMEMVFEK